jgi:hypothetical protein
MKRGDTEIREMLMGEQRGRVIRLFTMVEMPINDNSCKKTNYTTN